MGFNLDDYEPVADRVAKFWADHPEGSIITQLVKEDSEGVIIRATVRWESRRGQSEGVSEADGYARGIFGLSGKSAQATSPLEDCETSAVGRALANAGYQTKGRASREEMERIPNDNQVAGVDLSDILTTLNAPEKEAFKALLMLQHPGISLRNVHPDLEGKIVAIAIDVAADRYAEPAVADVANVYRLGAEQDTSEFSEEPF